MRAPAPVTPAPKPRANSRPRVGSDWRWVLDATMPKGQFTCEWVAHASKGALRCSQQTLTLIEQTDEGTDEYIDAREEAKRTMKTVMRDVSHLASTRAYGTVGPGRAPKMPTGIKALRDDAVKLVQELLATPSPTPEQAQEFACRYGRQRDAMKALREAFAEAEGAFETAQALLVAQMEG